VDVPIESGTPREDIAPTGDDGGESQRHRRERDLLRELAEVSGRRVSLHRHDSLVEFENEEET
jgi:hypothetical protein